MTCNLPRIRSPLWMRRTAEVGWANCKRGDRELALVGSVTSNPIMFPGLGTGDITEGVVRNGPAASGILPWREKAGPSPSARLRVRMTNQNGSGGAVGSPTGRYLAGVGTTSLGGALVMAAPNLDTNFGVWPFTISMMPG